MGVGVSVLTEGPQRLGSCLASVGTPVWLKRPHDPDAVERAPLSSIFSSENLFFESAVPIVCPPTPRSPRQAHRCFR